MNSPLPQSPNDAHQLARELLDGLKQEEERRSNQHPLLLAWSLRMEVSLHRDLRELAKSSGYSMTAILCTAFKLTLPTLKMMFPNKKAQAQALQQKLPVTPVVQPAAPPPPPVPRGIWQASSSTFQQ